MLIIYLPKFEHLTNLKHVNKFVLLMTLTMMLETTLAKTLVIKLVIKLVITQTIMFEMMWKIKLTTQWGARLKLMHCVCIAFALNLHSVCIQILFYWDLTCC